MSELGSMVNSTAWLYKECARDATKALVKNWIIPLASIAAYFAFIVIATALTPLGMAGGMLIGLAQIAFLTLFYGWISEAVRKNKVAKKDLLDFDYGIFSGLLSVAFILWIVNWMLGNLVQGLNVDWILAFVSLGIAIFLNPLPEVLYLHGSQSTQALQQAFTFVKENWIEWFLPFVILISPLILTVPSIVALLISQTQPLLPVNVIIAASAQLFPRELGPLSALLSITIAIWFLMFRGFLFQGLESGSRRRRAFLARQK